MPLKRGTTSSIIRILYLRTTRLLFNRDFLLGRYGRSALFGNLHRQHAVVLAGLDGIGVDIVGQDESLLEL